MSVNPLRSVRAKGGTERVRVPLRSPRGRLPRFAIVEMGLLCWDGMGWDGMGWDELCRAGLRDSKAVAAGFGAEPRIYLRDSTSSQARICFAQGPGQGNCPGIIYLR